MHPRTFMWWTSSSTSAHTASHKPVCHYCLDTRDIPSKSHTSVFWVQHQKGYCFAFYWEGSFSEYFVYKFWLNLKMTPFCLKKGAISWNGKKDCQYTNAFSILSHHHLCLVEGGSGSVHWRSDSPWSPLLPERAGKINSAVRFITHSSSFIQIVQLLWIKCL